MNEKKRLRFKRHIGYGEGTNRVDGYRLPNMPSKQFALRSNYPSVHFRFGRASPHTVAHTHTFYARTPSFAHRHTHTETERKRALSPSTTTTTRSLHFPSTSSFVRSHSRRRVPMLPHSLPELLKLCNFLFHFSHLLVLFFLLSTAIYFDVFFRC